MRVLLSTWGSRGDIEPLAALALRLRTLGGELRLCAPPDEEFAALLARVDVTPIPLGPSSPRGSRRFPGRPRAATRWWPPA
jgi:vancomycin aglycone glucosyltransferase